MFFFFLFVFSPHTLHGYFCKNSFVCQFIALIYYSTTQVMLMQPVREEMCPHTTSSFILIWFSCFAVWLKQSFLIVFLKAEFGDSKLFWGWLGDPSCLLTQSHKQPRMHHKTAMKLAITTPLLMTSEGLGSCNTRCLQKILGFLVLMSMHFQSHQRTSVITKGLWKWDGKVSAFILQISLNNVKHSWLGSIPGFRVPLTAVLQPLQTPS